MQPSASFSNSKILDGVGILLFSFFLFYNPFGVVSVPKPFSPVAKFSIGCAIPCIYIPCDVIQHSVLLTCLSVT